MRLMKSAKVPVSAIGPSLGQIPGPDIILRWKQTSATHFFETTCPLPPAIAMSSVGPMQGYRWSARMRGPELPERDIEARFPGGENMFSAIQSRFRATANRAVKTRSSDRGTRSCRPSMEKLEARLALSLGGEFQVDNHPAFGEQISAANASAPNGK